MTNARSVALDVTEQVRRDDAYANLALPDALRRTRLDTRDAGQCTDLTYGMQRWRRFLDAILAECVTGSLRRVDDGVLDLLRLAAYELVIRREPAHVINEWVNLAKQRFRRATGFVNATLRAVARRDPDDWNPVERGASTIDGVGVRWSHPDWIVAEYRTLVQPTELESLLRANNEPVAPCLVALPGLAERPSDATPTEFSPFGFVSPGGALDSVTGVTEGHVRPQDEGSQLAALALIASMPIRAGEKWLDLCAGPGGKAALLAASAIPAGASLVANEVHPHRVKLVTQSLRPFDSGVAVETLDGRTFGTTHAAVFDRVLVDAPCTGVGALRRRPESRWRKQLSDLETLVPLQRELLDAAITACAIGGVVAYVTCSPLTAETVDVVDAVLATRDDADVVPTAPVLRSIAPELADVERGSAAQLWPHRHQTDAMFIQLIRRTR